MYKNVTGIIVNVKKKLDGRNGIEELSCKILVLGARYWGFGVWGTEYGIRYSIFKIHYFLFDNQFNSS